MFIVWGRKIVHRRVGYVADFCPICRAKRVFEMMRVGSAGHVYYISFGEGELVGFERKCLECGTSYAADPKMYASVSKDLVTLPKLTSLTYPNFDEALRERLELEERVVANPHALSPEERQALIRSPFFFLSPKVEKRFSATHFDREIWWSLLIALGLWMFGPAVVAAIAPDAADVAMLVFLSLGAALVIWQFSQAGGRFMKREIIPVLSKSLHPLRPRESEIKSVLTELKQLGHKIGSKLRAADLHDHMRDLSV